MSILSAVIGIFTSFSLWLCNFGRCWSVHLFPWIFHRFISTTSHCLNYFSAFFSPWLIRLNKRKYAISCSYSYMMSFGSSDLYILKQAVHSCCTNIVYICSVFWRALQHFSEHLPFKIYLLLFLVISVQFITKFNVVAICSLQGCIFETVYWSRV